MSPALVALCEDTHSLFGSKVARLPSEGVLIVATDLQGNYEDYEALKAIYVAERDAGRAPILLFLGDLVHGPSERYGSPELWPDHLGAFYRDRSAELILDFQEFSRAERAVSLLGNHEHSHVGGPVVSKFHNDEAAVLEERLGDDCERVRAFMSTFPLMAVAPCGATFTHGAPRRSEPDLEAFEKLTFEGYEYSSIQYMHEVDTVGALLWSRYAEPERARELLRATSLTGEPGGFVAFGHDVVREGYEKIGEEQICVSTSFGCHDRNKYYLHLDLAARYKSVQDLRLGHELRRLYPEAV